MLKVQQEENPSLSVKVQHKLEEHEHIMRRHPENGMISGTSGKMVGLVQICNAKEANKKDNRCVAELGLQEG